MKPTRPALRWHGGKWMLAPWIISHFPPHRVYVEPFGGAALVLIQKGVSYAEVYNDLDDGAVGLFRVLRDEEMSRKLIDQLRLTPFSRTEFKQSYVKTECSIEAARRLIIRSFMGFGSNGHNKATGFRANSNRSGTTPARDWLNYPDALQAVVSRFQGVIIENRNALEVMAQHDGAETLHYVDPPYLMETRSDRGQDYAHEMSDSQHEELLHFLHGLAGAVVLSGYPSSLYNESLSDWRRIERASLADGAAKRTEVLWLNEAAATGSQNLFSDMETIA